MKIAMKDVHGKLETAKKAAQKYQEKADQVVEGVVTSLVTTGSAFVLGGIEGYTGGVEVVGVPLPLGAGFALHGAGFLLGGKSAPYLHAAANGAFATWGATMGRGIGKEMKAKGAGAAAKDAVKGLISGRDEQNALPPAGEKLDTNELERIAAGKAAAA